jgi:hypothetical protein
MGKNTVVLLALAGLCAGIVGAVPQARGEEVRIDTGAPSYLYRITFVRAAPGKLLDLIALHKGRMAEIESFGDERPLWWRHTQGDQWDLMLIYPMGSYTDYYAKGRVARRKGEAEFGAKLAACTSWREDLLVYGPPLEKLKGLFNAAAYYHIEIFVALPGKMEELFQERVRENIYQTGIGRPENMIFVRDQGAAWDMFTLGCYRDLAHWASSGDITREERAEAARKAGFESPDAIGPYMRTLIDFHRDTMGVAIR